MLIRRSCFCFKSIDFPLKSKAPRTIHCLKYYTKDSRSTHETFTLLRKTIEFIPRVLPVVAQGNPSSPTESFEFWNDILTGACEDLTLGEGRPAQIAVCGFGELSGAQDMITAILEEPLSSSQDQNEHIRGRWKDKVEKQGLTITTSPSSCSRPSTLVTQSAYLRRFPVPLEITEVSSIPLSTLGDSSSVCTIDESAARTLLRADVAIVVCNPFTTTLSTLFRTLPITTNPNTILVLSYTSPPQPESPSIPIPFFTPPTTPYETASQNREILFIDPARALSANRAITKNPLSPTVVQKYQDEYMNSNISTLTTSLKTYLSLSSKPSKDFLQNRTALAQLRVALHMCHTSLTRVRGELEDVAIAVAELSTRMEEARTQVRDVLGPGDRVKPIKVEDAVSLALTDAKQEMRQVMDHLTWWRMITRVDEISSIVNQALERSWCRSLEKELTMQTGQLLALQSDITASTFSMLSTYSTSLFKSAVLENTLSQLKASRHYDLTPQTLTKPIFSRSAQIVRYTTISLHIAGQRAALGMAGGAVGGVGLGWAGWVGWLAGSGEGLLGMIGMDVGTAVGAGLLVATGAIRWAVATWERSKRRWWEDWDRVSNGLDRDLMDVLDKTMQEKVLVVGNVGCKGLSGMVSERKKEIDLLELNLQKLHQDLQRLESES